MSQNHNAVQKIQHQIYTSNDNIHNYVQNKSGGQSVQIFILEGHISELKQDTILHVYLYHMYIIHVRVFPSLEQYLANIESYFNTCNFINIQQNKCNGAYAKKETNAQGIAE